MVEVMGLLTVRIGIKFVQPSGLHSRKFTDAVFVTTVGVQVEPDTEPVMTAPVVNVPLDTSKVKVFVLLSRYTDPTANEVAWLTGSPNVNPADSLA